ncbi:hypothetical protein GGI43DRAFT_386778 [Trichoderma evansii]
MPARTRKRKASEEEDAAPEVMPAAKKTSRAPCKSQKSSQEQPPKARKSSKKAQSENSESSNPTRASKKANSTASGVSTAKRDIRKKADELIHIIESQAEDGPSDLGSGTITTGTKMTPLWTDKIGLEPETIRRNPNTIYQKSCEHIQSMHETIEEYKRVNRATANLAKPAEIKQWEQDSKDITKVDKRAMEILINKLNVIVTGEKKAEHHRSLARSADEVEQAARKWLQTGISTGEETWGDAAREAIKALSGLAKILS